MSFVVWKENNEFVTQCLNVDISSCGKSIDETVKNLKKAVELYFECEPDFIMPKIKSIYLGKEIVNV